MATQPCNLCANFDPILRGTKEGRHGRCAAKSFYLAVEQKGQVFPDGVKRVEPGELARPFIIVGSAVQKNCNEFRIAPVKTNKGKKK